MKVITCNKIDILNYFTNALSPEKQHLIEEHIKTCNNCRDYLSELKREKDDFLSRFPQPSYANNKSSETKFYNFPKIHTSYSKAAMIIFCLLGISILSINQFTNNLDFRTKGAQGINIFTLDSTGNILPFDSQKDTLYPSQRIQFTYSNSKKGYGVLFSIDKQGNINQFFPESDTITQYLKPGQNIPLPNSIILDEYVGKEDYIFVFTKKPESVTKLKNKISNLNFDESKRFKLSKDIFCYRISTLKGIPK